MSTELIIIVTILSSLIVGLFVAFKKERKNSKGHKEILDKQLTDAEAKYKKLIGQKKSSEINLGLASEQIAPFLEDFKYNPQQCRFMGEPIDYIHFGDDEITFIEVKSQNSNLIPKQRKIRDIIAKGKVKFEVFRISGKKPAEDKKK